MTMRALPAILLATAAAAGTLPVTLPDGRTFQVETTFGRPVKAEAPGVSVEALEPVEGPEGPAWRLQLELERPGKVRVEVRSLLAPELLETFTLEGPGDPERLMLLPEPWPEAWEWVEAPGTSWLPFRITVRGEGAPAELLQWVKVKASDKARLREALSQSDAPVMTREVRVGGRTFQVRTRGGWALPLKAPGFRLWRVAVAVSPREGARVPVMVFQGATLAPGRHRMEIRSLLLPEVRVEQALEGQGSFTVATFDRAACPELWVGEGDLWQPFQVRLLDEAGRTEAEGTVWAWLSGAGRKALEDATAASGSPEASRSPRGADAPPPSGEGSPRR